MAKCTCNCRDKKWKARITGIALFVFGLIGLMDFNVWPFFCIGWGMALVGFNL